MLDFFKQRVEGFLVEESSTTPPFQFLETFTLILNTVFFDFFQVYGYCVIDDNLLYNRVFLNNILYLKLNIITIIVNIGAHLLLR